MEVERRGTLQQDKEESARGEPGSCGSNESSDESDKNYNGPKIVGVRARRAVGRRGAANAALCKVSSNVAGLEEGEGGIESQAGEEGAAEAGDEGGIGDENNKNEESSAERSV